MPMTKFESPVKIIPSSQETVYNKLSDLRNVESVKDQLPKDKIKDLSFDEDTISLQIAPVGQLTLKIIEREPYGCIKFETTNSPLPFNLWIQIVPVHETECKMKLTIGLELNPFIKGMVQKPLRDGLVKLADVLAAIPY